LRHLRHKNSDNIIWASADVRSDANSQPLKLAVEPLCSHIMELPVDKCQREELQERACCEI
jgi:hypothetical protein